MTDYLSEKDVIAAIEGMTPRRLISYISAEVVIPVQTENGPMFGHIDIARMRLLCELSDDLDLDETALGIIMSLIDQLHATRRDLRAIARAVQAEPDDVRARIGAALLQPQD